ncbi:helix-turn-helix transcriptional regulator [Bradyrhizobium sp.]|uniref:helix-turn-helix transcriptional regulator n=1 Tax=Bradyrhizobium sp. TaxID=376 RepID=UPI003C299380
MDDHKTGSRPRRMLNEKQVLEIVPYSSVTLYRMDKRGEFPRSTYISPDRRIWFEDEIATWQKEINGRRRSQMKATESR